MNADPLDVLHDLLGGPDAPTDPGPTFAAGLRARLVRALMTGATMSTTAIRTGRLTPYLTVADARAALDWYVTVLGAVESSVITMPDGRVGHAELDLAGARIYLADAFPEIGLAEPTPGRTAVSLHLEVDDVDRLAAAMTARGASLDQPVADSPYGRNGTVLDPFGHRWQLMTPAPAAPSYPVNGVHAGDVSYVTIQVPDLAAAQAFYGAVLGWSFTPGHAEHGAQVVESAPMVGLWAGPDNDHRGAVLAYRVADVAAAVEQVRAGGGTATDVENLPYALSSTCTDPSGLRFWLHQMDDAPMVPDGAQLRQGDLSYITFGVPDGERDRAFYAAVLGWRYEDGNPEGLLPRTGMWSPADRKVQARSDEWTQQLGAVLCYQVDDIAAAVKRLRSAGGECDEPQQRPYGLEVHGHDDQGLELYLHQLIQ